MHEISRAYLLYSEIGLDPAKIVQIVVHQLGVVLSRWFAPESVKSLPGGHVDHLRNHADIPNVSAHYKIQHNNYYYKKSRERERERDSQLLTPRCYGLCLLCHQGCFTPSRIESECSIMQSDFCTCIFQLSGSIPNFTTVSVFCIWCCSRVQFYLQLKYSI